MSAIVLGSDTPIGLAVIRDLGAHGVTVHAVGRSLTSIGGASRFAATNRTRPAGPLAEWLPDLIAATGARALLAISEGDLLALAELPETIGGCRMLTPRRELLSIVLDKSETLARAAALGFDVPASWQPEAEDDFAVRAAGLDYPVVLKWADPPAMTAALDTHGIAFEKAEFATDAARLLAILQRYDRLERWPLVQGYCAGHGLGQMLHIEGGVATMRFQHRRLHEWPPEGGVSTLCAAVPLAEHAVQMAKSEALLSAIGWSGPAMVEYRHDPATGRYWLMEINGRFWGSLPLASACGATFAWELYRRAILDDIAPAALPRGDLRARYMIPETKRLVRLLLKPGTVADPLFRAQPLRDLARYGAGFFDRRTCYYVFRLDDPGPMLRDLGNIVRKALPRAVARKNIGPRLVVKKLG